MCLVNPYSHLRDDLKNNNGDQIVQIFLTSTRDLRKDYHVKDFERGEPDYIVDTDYDTKKTFENLLVLINNMDDSTG